MTPYTPKHLEMFARGERLPQDVFNAIVHDPGALTRVYQLMRVRALFTDEETLGPADAARDETGPSPVAQQPGPMCEPATESLP